MKLFLFTLFLSVFDTRESRQFTIWWHAALTSDSLSRTFQLVASSKRGKIMYKTSTLTGKETFFM